MSNLEKALSKISDLLDTPIEEEVGHSLDERLFLFKKPPLLKLFTDLSLTIKNGQDRVATASWGTRDLGGVHEKIFSFSAVTQRKVDYAISLRQVAEDIIEVRTKMKELGYELGGQGCEGWEHFDKEISLKNVSQEIKRVITTFRDHTDGVWTEGYDPTR